MAATEAPPASAVLAPPDDGLPNPGWDYVPGQDYPPEPLVLTVAGDFGTGKTHLAHTFPGPILLFDSESRARRVSRKFRNTYIKCVKSFPEIQVAIGWAVRYFTPSKGRRPGTIVFDSGSDFRDYLDAFVVAEMKAEQLKVHPTLHWTKTYAMLAELLADLRGRGWNVVFTARLAEVYENDKKTGKRDVADFVRNKLYFHSDFVLELARSEKEVVGKVLKNGDKRIGTYREAIPAAELDYASIVKSMQEEDIPNGGMEAVGGKPMQSGATGGNAALPTGNDTSFGNPAPEIRMVTPAIHATPPPVSALFSPTPGTGGVSTPETAMGGRGGQFNTPPPAPAPIPATPASPVSPAAPPAAQASPTGGQPAAAPYPPKKDPDYTIVPGSPEAIELSRQMAAIKQRKTIDGHIQGRLTEAAKAVAWTPEQLQKRAIAVAKTLGNVDIPGMAFLTDEEAHALMDELDNEIKALRTRAPTVAQQGAKLAAQVQADIAAATASKGSSDLFGTPWKMNDTQAKELYALADRAKLTDDEKSTIPAEVCGRQIMGFNQITEQEYDKLILKLRDLANVRNPLGPQPTPAGTPTPLAPTAGAPTNTAAGAPTVGDIMQELVDELTGKPPLPEDFDYHLTGKCENRLVPGGSEEQERLAAGKLALEWSLTFRPEVENRRARIAAGLNPVSAVTTDEKAAQEKGREAMARLASAGWFRKPGGAFPDAIYEIECLFRALGAPPKDGWARIIDRGYAKEPRKVTEAGAKKIIEGLMGVIIKGGSK